MNQILAVLKKSWVVLVAVAVAILSVVLFKKRTPPPTIVKPPDPPKKVTVGDMVKEYNKRKEDSDAQVDKLSRDDLVSDINSRKG